MPKYQYFALTAAEPDQLEAFEEWYDNQHLKDVRAVAAVVSAKRYRLLPHLDNVKDEGSPPTWNSLAIYELDTDDPLAVARLFADLAGSSQMPLSPAMSPQHVTLLAELVKEI